MTMNKTVFENGFIEFRSEHYSVNAFDSSWFTVSGDIDEGFFEGDSSRMMELLALLSWAMSEIENA